MQQQTKNRLRPTPANSGYTLTELLVVLVILGLVMGLVAPRFIGQIGGAKAKTAAAQVENLASAVEFFHLDTGRYPSKTEGLGVLVAKPQNADGWNGPYLKRGRLPDDPWGNPYLYDLMSNGNFEVKTLGADAKPGGEDNNRDQVSGS